MVSFTALLLFWFWQPIHFCLRFFFYKIFVPTYSWYLKILKRLGWRHWQGSFFTFLWQQKLVHILVVVITVFLMTINLVPQTHAGDLTNSARQTILADLIKSEFYDFNTEDEQLIVETFNHEATITTLEQTYLDNLALKPIVGLKPETKEEIEIPTIQEGTSLVKPDMVTTKISKRPRDKIITYVVKPGDTISTIAQKFGISVSTILWENNLSVYSIIHPGDKLSILPFSGISHTVKRGETLSRIAEKYGVEKEEILKANKLASANQLKIGQKLLIPGGKKSYSTYRPRRYSGLSTIRNIVKAPNARPVAGNRMNWPTVGHRITQYYSWRHHAIDIANKIGTPIYAADAGVIEYAGWGRGYGNQIVINHGGGKKTRYAHLSKFYVKKGDPVSKGQTIGAMGSTGWSTGPHLHFEVIINGRKYNPLNYIR